MKSIILFTVLLICAKYGLNQKELTLEKSIIGYDLYPSTVKQLGWLSDVDKYFYATDTSILIKTADCVIDYEILISDLDKNKGIVPQVISLSDQWIVYRVGSQIVKKMYRATNEMTKAALVLSFPKQAQHIKYCKENFSVAYTVKNNLFVATTIDSMIPITSNEDENIISGQAIHRYEFGISEGIFWSPDGSKLAFYQKNETDVADYPLLNINETPGALKTVKYPMAGQKSEYGKVGLYDIETKKLSYLSTTGKDDAYLTNLTWGPNNQKIYLAQVNREQNEMLLNQYDAKSGLHTESLVYLKNDKWVEPEYPLYFNPVNDKEFIWVSEHNGFMELYTFDLNKMKYSKLSNLKQYKSIRKGKKTFLGGKGFPITSVIGYNNTGTHFYFMATGIDPKNNLGYRVNVKNGKINLLTSEEGIHNCKVSSSGSYITDVYSSLGSDTKTDVINVNTTDVVNIHASANSLKEYNIGETVFTTHKSVDGFDLHGRLIYPAQFDSTIKHPVLVYVYGGPHAQLVKNNWLGGASLWMHWMANQGYVVYTIDGRGSANRGFKFESVIHRKLGEKEMEDQLVGVEYLKTLPYVDSNRLAVHGWSFGGFMTTSLMLKHPNVFTTGVAGGPVMDWKWYEVMYGERYMDTPDENPEGYKQTSTLNYVKNLKGKLLTIHGTVDDVVVMQHNLAFIKACIDNGVQTDFFPYPMHPHNVRGKDRVHLMTKVLNYVLDHNK